MEDEIKDWRQARKDGQTGRKHEFSYENDYDYRHHFENSARAKRYERRLSGEEE